MLVAVAIATLRVSLCGICGQNTCANPHCFGRQRSWRFHFMANTERGSLFDLRPSIGVIHRWWWMIERSRHTHRMIERTARPWYCDFWIDFRCNIRPTIFVHHMMHVMIGVAVMLTVATIIQRTPGNLRVMHAIAIGRLHHIECVGAGGMTDGRRRRRRHTVDWQQWMLLGIGWLFSVRITFETFINWFSRAQRLFVGGRWRSTVAIAHIYFGGLHIHFHFVLISDMVSSMKYIYHLFDGITAVSVVLSLFTRMHFVRVPRDVYAIYSQFTIKRIYRTATTTWTGWPFEFSHSSATPNTNAE